MYEKGLGVTRDIKQAIHFYSLCDKNAKKGDPGAIFRIGYVLFNEEGEIGDCEKGAQLMLCAAQEGDT